MKNYRRNTPILSRQKSRNDNNYYNINISDKSNCSCQETFNEKSDRLIQATIIKSIGGKFAVIDNDKNQYSCSARGIFRYDKIKPLPGDKVLINISGYNRPDGNRGSDDGSNGIIEKILPRKNTLIRPPLANLDKLFVIISSAYPSPSTIISDKLITIAEFNMIEPVIIVSKSDLDKKSSDRIEKIYKQCGFTVFETSCENKTGISDLIAYISQTCKNEISSFAGVSGAGKSTLMNTLFSSLSLETGKLSEKIGRGKNTTRVVELFPLYTLLPAANNCEGFIADTPGFSMIDFSRFDFYKLEDLPNTFREFRHVFEKNNCLYKNCTHTKEDGCAIIDAVKNGIIPEERHQSYLEIYSVLKSKHEWE